MRKIRSHNSYQFCDIGVHDAKIMKKVAMKQQVRYTVMHFNASRTR